MGKIVGLMFFVACLSAFGYYVGVPYYHKIQLENSVDAIIAKGEYSIALNLIDSDDKVPQIWIDRIKEKIVSSAGTRWAKYRTEINTHLMSKRLDDAKSVLNVARQSLSGVSKPMNIELSQVGELIDKIKSDDEIKIYEDEIAILLANTNIARSNTKQRPINNSEQEPDPSVESLAKQSYLSDLSEAKRYYHEAVSNKTLKGLYRHSLVMAMVIHHSMANKYSDVLDSEFFLLRKQINDEKKVAGDTKLLKKLITDELDSQTSSEEISLILDYCKDQLPDLDVSKYSK